MCRQGEEGSRAVCHERERGLSERKFSVACEIGCRVSGGDHDMLSVMQYA